MADLLEQVDRGVGQAIWAGADAEARDPGFGDRRFVDFAQVGDFRVGIGVTLKVGQEMSGVEALADARETGPDLSADVRTPTLLAEVGT